MKNSIILSIALMLAVSPMSVLATGNGAPSGAHFNLNLIGTNEKISAMDDNSGHRIFVNIEGKTKISLVAGDDFRVLDANGTDGNGAKFQLPNPDADNDGVTTYSVYARALGKPGGKSSMTSCGTGAGLDGIFGTADDEEICSIATLNLERTKGKSEFGNVSKELLYVYADLNGDSIAERYPLFDEALRDYFWNYDNNGMKLVQLRFYEVATDTN
jgi:hypothetical protein